MIKRFNTISVCAFFVSLVSPNVYALSHRSGDFNFALTGYGTAGIIEPNFEKPDFVGDFRVRAQATYNRFDNHTIGAVYMMDEMSLDQDDWYHDIFGFWQWRGVGRIEVGFTNSVANKLGLGLPDVGGLRINNSSLIYRKMGVSGPVISDPTITNGSSAPRMNLVMTPNSRVQYGFSVSGIDSDYDFGVDAGIKIKHSVSKTKYALSLGAAFMNRPDGFSTDSFTPDVTADWRAQFYAGLNIQYNSWIFAGTFRAIYDEDSVDRAVDGLVAGAGISYDVLNYTLSLSYMFSDTGIWHTDDEVYADHTVVASFRYKYSKYIDGWTSIGMSRSEPFLAAGIRLTF